MWANINLNSHAYLQRECIFRCWCGRFCGRQTLKTNMLWFQWMPVSSIILYSFWYIIPNEKKKKIYRCLSWCERSQVKIGSDANCWYEQTKINTKLMLNDTFVFKRLVFVLDKIHKLWWAVPERSFVNVTWPLTQYCQVCRSMWAILLNRL